jgi:putative cell wall-binding protein
VLLVHPTQVGRYTQSALDYLNPTEVVVIGGPNSVSKQVYDDLGADRRLWGANRWETAVAVSKQFDADIDGTYVASGEVFPDALAGSALSGHLGQPITLSAKNTVPEVVMSELDRLSPDKVTILGGPATLTGEVEKQLNAAYPSWRK